MNSGRQPVRSVLIKPASSQCNLACSYCFYHDEAKNRGTASYGTMSEQTAECIVRKILGQGTGTYTFAFQGGEPLLAGLPFFENFFHLTELYNSGGSQIRLMVQTNGTLLTEEFCDLFARYHVLVGVSLDGTQAVHDACRKTADDRPTHSRVEEGLRLLRRAGCEFNILTVVTGETVSHIREIYRYFMANGWKYQQYIPCLDPIESGGQHGIWLSDEQYGEFLISLFDLWYKDWKRNRAPYIREFDNWIGILMGRRPESCAMTGICSLQCVIEADGSVYPCDFYCLDEWKLGNIRSGPVRKLTESEKGGAFVRMSVQQRSGRCETCPYRILCRTGCRRDRIPDGEGGYISRFCRSYQAFFETCGDRMREIAEYLENSARHS
ncbi:MAG: anaerobic sulfatase maturase [Lachnospiraceae bacterium]|jgi:uncharacterized protein